MLKGFLEPSDAVEATGGAAGSGSGLVVIVGRLDPEVWAESDEAATNGGGSIMMTGLLYMPSFVVIRSYPPRRWGMVKVECLLLVMTVCRIEVCAELIRPYSTVSIS